MNSHARQRRLDSLQRHIERLDSRMSSFDRLSRKCSRLRTALVLAGIFFCLVAERFLGSPLFMAHAWRVLSARLRLPPPGTVVCSEAVPDTPR